MSQFTEKRDWCQHLEGRTYVTTRPLDWDVGALGSGLRFTVPTGAVFDLSIPAPLTPFFDVHDPRYLKAACLHDEMLRRGWSRVSSGAEFHEALRATGVSPARRIAMWLTVSFWKYWKDNRRKFSLQRDSG